MSQAELIRNDGIHLVIQFTMTFIAISANSLLLVAIKKKTPPSMRAFSIFLTNTAISDIISAICLYLTCTRLISAPDGRTILIFLGPCTRISSEFCLLCHCLQACLSNHSTLLILLTFYHRLITLIGAKNRFYVKSNAIIWIACSLSLLFTLLITVAYYSLGEKVPFHISKIFNIANYTLIEFPCFSPRVFAIMLPVLAQNPTFLTIIFFLRWKLVQKIKKSSKPDRAYHNKIVKILTYQSMLPLGSTVSLVYWSLDKYIQHSSEISQRMLMMGVSFICLASPIINLVFLPPYRKIFSYFHIAPQQLFFSQTSA